MSEPPLDIRAKAHAIPFTTREARPRARVLVNALAMHEAADGARTFIEALLRGLPTAWPEAQIMVIARRDAPLPQGARIEPIPFGSSGSGAVRVLDELIRLRRVVREADPDLVISPNESIPTGINAPVIVVAQNLLYHCPEIGPVNAGPWSSRLRSRLQFGYYRWRMPRAYERATATITVSAHAARELAEHGGLDISTARVVHCGADRLQVRPRAEPPHGKKPLLAVGAIAHYKRLDNAIRALEILRRESSSYELWLVGSSWPGQRAALESLARSLSVGDAVRFLGPVEGEQLADLFAICHAGLSLSACETFCIPVVEGLRAGLPHVVADEPWSAETVADTVVRVDARDPMAIAAGIKRLDGREEWRRMADLGRQRARRYTWEANARGIAAVAIEVIERERAVSPVRAGS